MDTFGEAQLAPLQQLRLPGHPKSWAASTGCLEVLAVGERGVVHGWAQVREAVWACSLGLAASVQGPPRTQESQGGLFKMQALSQ